MNAVGLLRVVRHQKKYRIVLSDGWRTITTEKQAMIVSEVARVQPMPPQMTPSQPASVSA
jgi:hypothetical protein